MSNSTYNYQSYEQNYRLPDTKREQIEKDKKEYEDKIMQAKKRLTTPSLLLLLHQPQGSGGGHRLPPEPLEQEPTSRLMEGL